jgi:putative nucleotidyltransferase with HDIG domain
MHAMSAPASGPVLVIPDLEGEGIFVVDDDARTLEVMVRILRQGGYAPQGFGRPAAALAQVRPGHPKVLITDNDMPEMTGLELAEKALEIDPEIRVVVVTGAGDEGTAQAALRLGSTDYLRKPIEVAELIRAAQKALMSHIASEFTNAMDDWLQDEVRRQTEVVREVTIGTVETLVQALEARSPHFKGHSHRVAECAEAIAHALDLSEETVSAIRQAALLHDVGMIAVADAIVNKPTNLDSAEYQEIKSHCRKGAQILEPMTHLGPVATFILEHHERLDGSGYPDGKKGTDISVGGQVVGLAEAWSALTEGRAFRDRMTHADAMAALSAAAGRWFAPELLAALRASQKGA